MTESQQHSEMFANLIADGPMPELAEELSVFGQFVGRWDLVSDFWFADGTELRTDGVWLFDWILDGRGIQDVLLMDSGTGLVGRGTTTRVYDPVDDNWKIAWLGPVSRSYVNLIGGQHGDRIVLEGPEGAEKVRWSFNQITRDGFVWLGHISTDGGANWRLEQRMTACRRR